MNDLERIKHIKKTLGITLKLVPAAKLSTEHSFFTTANIFLYSLADRLDPKFFFKGVRNYSLDENGNVTGLALDFCGLFLLEDNYLGNFAKLKKLKLKNSYLNDYSFFDEIGKLARTRPHRKSFIELRFSQGTERLNFAQFKEQ